MSEPVIITLDGPAGVGKSTVSALLAEKLGMPTLDTGAMFRYLAWKLGEAALSVSAAELMARDFHFSLAGCGARSSLLCNGEPMGAEIRSEKVTALSSRIAARPEIREFLLLAQREIAFRQSLVADGRDMGTVVFPHARFKFFLDAEPRIRAMRRQRDFAKLGQKVDLDQLTREIEARDKMDRSRQIAPLKPAQDAVILDTSRLDIEEVLNFILDYIKKHGGIPERHAC